MLVDPKKIRMVALVTNAILVKVSLIAGGYFLGDWIDKLVGTSPLFMMIFILVGMGLGIWWIVIISQRMK